MESVIVVIFDLRITASLTTYVTWKLRESTDLLCIVGTTNGRVDQPRSGRGAGRSGWGRPRPALTGSAIAFEA